MSGRYNGYKNVVIIGAARSGTNMLRDVLTSLDGFETWPCDEIPFIWRYGNSRCVHDEFTPSMARLDTKRYIRKAFTEIATATNASYVVEKTCANSLRVGFVDKILPEAKYIYLIRDGRDAIPSAMKRWTAPLDIPYLLKKARFVPFRDLPHYSARFITNRIKQYRYDDRRMGTWGPRFNGMDEMVESSELHLICSYQWLRSIENSERDFCNIDDSKIFRLKYEKFVTSPSEYLSKLVDYLGIEVSDYQIKSAVKQVSTACVDKGKNSLEDDVLKEIVAIISEALIKTGYTV